MGKRDGRDPGKNHEESLMFDDSDWNFTYFLPFAGFLNFLDLHLRQSDNCQDPGQAGVSNGTSTIRGGF
jgi:hypothetical protein